MAEQYIFTIEGLSKAYGKKEVLKDIWLAFFPGATPETSTDSPPDVATQTTEEAGQ